MRAIYKKSHGQKVMVAACPDDHMPVGGDAFVGDFTFIQYPEASEEIKAYIDSHAFDTLQLYAVEADHIRLRTTAEIDAVKSVQWEYKIQEIPEQEE